MFKRLNKPQWDNECTAQRALHHRSLLKKLSKLSLPLLLASAVGFTSACSSLNSPRPEAPNVPFNNIDVHAQKHPLTSTDRLCVFNGGDMITYSGTRYRNSGRFMQRIVFNTLSQYNVDGVVDMLSYTSERTKVEYLQEAARSEGCNIITVVRPIFWLDSQVSPGNVSVEVDMHDTSSLEKVNSATLNARSNYIADMFTRESPLRPVIEEYIDRLYR